MSISPDPETFLIEAYQGEVLGEAFFALMAEREEDETRIDGWRRLERLERHVKLRLREELERRDLDVAEDPSRVAAGRELARGLSKLPWDECREAISYTVRGDASEMRASIGEVLAEIEEIAQFFLGHEEALLAFFDVVDTRSKDGWFGGERDPVSEFLAAVGAPDESPIPEGLKLTPLDPAYQADPAAVHRELMMRAPVHRDREFGGVHVCGHDRVHEIVYDLDLWADPRKAREGDPVRLFINSDDTREPSMLFLDDPEHKRLRNLVSRSFTPRAVNDLHPVIEAVADELLDAVESDGASEFDLIDRLAAPLPAIAIARILGVDPARQAQFKKWSMDASEAFFNPFAAEDKKQAGVEAGAALDACFREEIARRRAEPANDLIGELVAAEREGDRLSEPELVTMCNLLLIAGNVTTTDLIGNGMRALLEHPDEHGKLRARPELVENAVEEMLRFDPPVHVTGRIASRDIEIDGVPVAKGESVNVILAAANRDPAVYPDPDRFDVERADTHHHSFGGGAHLCLGAHLARAEARAAVRGLVARFPKMRSAGRPLAWKQTPGFRGLSELWVRID